MDMLKGGGHPSKAESNRMHRVRSLFSPNMKSMDVIIRYLEIGFP